MKNINNMLSRSVSNLVKAVGPRIRLYSDLENDKTMPNYIPPTMCHTRGFYDGSLDLIGVCDKDSSEADEIVLHELIHYTGAKNRLNRSWIVNNALQLQNKPYKEQTNKDMQTEEATAQIGMLKLVLVLGLNPARFVDATYNYVNNLPDADLNKADRDSDKAVEYLVKFIGMEKVA